MSPIGPVNEETNLVNTVGESGMANPASAAWSR
jgi:hypothetical protein